MGALADTMVAIYALDRANPVWESDQGVEIVSVSGERNVRLIRQGGHFTLARNPFATLEEWIESCKANGALVRFLISFHEAPKALSDLRLMGINYATLFGDEPDSWAREALSKVVLETL